MIGKRCLITCLLLIAASAACGSDPALESGGIGQPCRSTTPRCDLGLTCVNGTCRQSDGIVTDAGVDFFLFDALVLDLVVDHAAGEASTDAGQDVSSADAAHDSPSAVDAEPVVDAEPDAEPCPTEPCDLLEQCGCESEACDTTFQTSGLTVCRAITKQGTELDPCGASTECAAGYLCLGGGRWSRCKRFCGDKAGCHGGAGSHCFSVFSGGSPVANTKYCTANCDPMASSPAGCPAGWQCFALYNSGTSQAYSECASPGPQGVGGPCDDAADCAKDLTCVFFNTAGQCLYECRKSAPASGCPGKRTCFSYTPRVKLGGIEYGYCN